tara:strand:+ start:4767 stop:4919 length:153 start_codon:yes stop_codon:yes gene_type:complete
MDSTEQLLLMGMNHTETRDLESWQNDFETVVTIVTSAYRQWSQSLLVWML